MQQRRTGEHLGIRNCSVCGGPLDKRIDISLLSAAQDSKKDWKESSRTLRLERFEPLHPHSKACQTGLLSPSRDPSRLPIPFSGAWHLLYGGSAYPSYSQHHQKRSAESKKRPPGLGGSGRRANNGPGLYRRRRPRYVPGDSPQFALLRHEGSGRLLCLVSTPLPTTRCRGLWEVGRVWTT